MRAWITRRLLHITFMLFAVGIASSAAASGLLVAESEGKCLVPSLTSVPTAAVLTECKPEDPRQRWVHTNSRKIQNIGQSQGCLTTNGTTVSVASCSDLTDKGQNWLWDANVHSVRSQTYLNCLDGTGSSVVLRPCERNRTSQVWFRGAHVTGAAMNCRIGTPFVSDGVVAEHGLAFLNQPETFTLARLAWGSHTLGNYFLIQKHSNRNCISRQADDRGVPCNALDTMQIYAINAENLSTWMAKHTVENPLRNVSRTHDAFGNSVVPFSGTSKPTNWLGELFVRRQTTTKRYQPGAPNPLLAIGRIPSVGGVTDPITRIITYPNHSITGASVTCESYADRNPSVHAMHIAEESFLVSKYMAQQVNASILDAMYTPITRDQEAEARRLLKTEPSSFERALAYTDYISTETSSDYDPSIKHMLENSAHFLAIADQMLHADKRKVEEIAEAIARRVIPFIQENADLIGSLENVHGRSLVQAGYQSGPGLAVQVRVLGVKLGVASANLRFTFPLVTYVSTTNDFFLKPGGVLDQDNYRYVVTAEFDYEHSKAVIGIPLPNGFELNWGKARRNGVHVLESFFVNVLRDTTIAEKSTHLSQTTRERFAQSFRGFFRDNSTIRVVARDQERLRNVPDAAIDIQITNAQIMGDFASRMVGIQPHLSTVRAHWSMIPGAEAVTLARRAHSDGTLNSRLFRLNRDANHRPASVLSNNMGDAAPVSLPDASIGNDTGKFFRLAQNLLGGEDPRSLVPRLLVEGRMGMVGEIAVGGKWLNSSLVEIDSCRALLRTDCGSIQPKDGLNRMPVIDVGGYFLPYISGRLGKRWVTAPLSGSYKEDELVTRALANSEIRLQLKIGGAIWVAFDDKTAAAMRGGWYQRLVNN